MSRYIDAASAAETFAEKTGMPFADVVEIFENIPYANVLPVIHGKWLLRWAGAKHFWECSACHSETVEGIEDYCQFCGAKMDKEEQK